MSDASSRLVSVGVHGDAAIALVAELRPGPESVVDLAVATRDHTREGVVRLPRHVTLAELDAWREAVGAVADKTEGRVW